MGKKLLASIVLASALVAVGCRNPVNPQGPSPKSSAKEITAFAFQNPMAIGTIDQAAHVISVSVPHGTDRRSLAPIIAHTGASVSPESGKPTDFTDPATYTVTAADGSVQAYSVTVTVLPAAYALTIAALSGGAISANDASFEAGDQVRLTVSPDVERFLKAGSLRYTPEGGGPIAIDETSRSFTMPASSVTVAADFVTDAQFRLAIHPSWPNGNMNLDSQSVALLYIKNSYIPSLAGTDLRTFLTSHADAGFYYEMPISSFSSDAYSVRLNSLTGTGVNPVYQSFMTTSYMTGVLVSKTPDGNFLVEVDPDSMTKIFRPVAAGSAVPDLTTLKTQYTPFLAGNIVYDGRGGYDFNESLLGKVSYAVPMRRSSVPLEAPQPFPVHTLSFMSNGGSSVPPIYSKMGYPLTEPAEPLYSGHGFLGWYRDAGLSSPWSFDTDRLGDLDVALYARWTDGNLLSLNRPVTVSCGSAWFDSPANAVDGNLATAYKSDINQTTQWMYVDLGTPRSMNGFRFVFTGPSSYVVQYSNDAANWSNYGSSYAPTTTAVVFPSPISARYLRIYCVAMVLNCRELSIYGN